MLHFKNKFVIISIVKEDIKMENKNGRGIFLGVVSVATLVVAIIGATFAFFSASGGSANNAVTAGATTLTGAIELTSANNKLATNLIPVAAEDQFFPRYPGVAASGEHSCLDDKNNEICSVYEFTITNTASIAQTIYVSFDPVTNSFANLYFAAFNTTIANANFQVATGGTGTGASFVLTPQTSTGNATIGHQATKLTTGATTNAMPGLTTTLNAGASVTYTILVWLQETGDDQNTEQGGSFAAGVNVTTGSGSGGVTGVMSAGA